MPESTDGRLDRIRLHLSDTKNREFYSIQRIDLLVISVSGAGIYLVFETLKFIIEQKLQFDKGLLVTGGIAFVAAIILNFISQWTGYYTNKNEACWAQLEHKRACDGALSDDERCDQRMFDRGATGYGRWTRALNMLSTILMLLGIALMVWFNFNSFSAA